MGQRNEIENGGLRLDRRSFLSLAASALGIVLFPAREDGGGNSATSSSPSNSIISGWENAFQAYGTIIISPGQRLDERTFFPPLPVGLRIRGLRILFDGQTALRDLTTVYEGVGFQASCDGHDLITGPIMRLPQMGFGLGNTEPLPIFPELRPKKDFHIALSSDPMELSRPVEAHVVIDGICYIKGEHE